METGGLTIEKKFSSPEEEIAFLREKIAEKEKGLSENLDAGAKEQAAAEIVREYQATPPAEVLAENYKIEPKAAGEIILNIAPEPHDRQIEKLIAVLQERGLRNVLSVVEKMRNPHLEDDFHRFLVQYIKAGFPVPGLKEKDRYWRPTRMTLFEVTLPDISKEDAEKELKRLVSAMEQFYAGLLSVSPTEEKKGSTLTLEFANANDSDEFIFYAAVPDSKRDLFEKQIFSLFSGAKIREEKNDYNIFNEIGASVGSFAISGRNPVFPLKIYDEFDVDPLNVILNSFSKLDKNGEGAAIQFVFYYPSTNYYLEKYKYALEQIQKGVPVKEATDIPISFFDDARLALKHLFSDKHLPKKETDPKKPLIIDQMAVENIQRKIESPIVSCNIRIIASGADKASAEEIISDVEASFNQFDNAKGNKLSFKRVEKSDLRELTHQFSWRIFSRRQELPLSVKEITTLFHFPSSHIKSAPSLKQASAGTSAAPLGLPAEGTLLGVNRDRSAETKVFILPEDRMRHFYTIGQTGTGKTTLFKNMIVQDMKAGAGVCMIDPHGSDIQDILATVPPERYEDVVYFDPSYTERPMALNMLEYDKNFPEQKTFVVNEMLSIFDRLFDMKVAGGPMFEQYFRNAVLLTIEDSDSGNTLLDVSRVLSNKAFRDMKLSKCGNPLVTQFWREVAEKAGGEAALANIVPYVVSKFDNFLANDIMRPIIAQEKSSFNFREIMDSRKILLVNLAKGRLGEQNSHLIGMILVGKILMAALSRVDSFGKILPDFYLYLDEFQNITTDSIAAILSEARKYRLGLCIAHQFIGQLTDKIKGAVFGNVGTIASFRVGPEDAEFLEKQFAPVFSARDLVNLENKNAYLKLLVNGRPMKPFNIETLPPFKGVAGNIDKLKELSYLKFGRPRAEVEAEIRAKYQQK